MNAALSKGLEIHKLRADGSTIRRINCLAGRITVFRSISESEVALFEAAISGRATGERFTILYSGNKFNPKEHNSIGLGADFVLGSPQTVHQYLLANHIPTGEIEALLLNNSLGGLSAARCSELGPAQQRILRLLAISGNPQQVHVLCDPFLHLPPTIKENLALYLIAFIAAQNGLIIVTRLTERPEAWVENEYISRAQLERPRSHTVGFGSDAIRIQDLSATPHGINLLNAIPLVKLGNNLYLSASLKKLLIHSRTIPLPALALACISAILVIVSLITFWLPIGPSLEIKTTAITPQQSEHPLNDSGHSSSSGSEQQEFEISPEASNYPSSVNEAVLKAFLRPDELLGERLKPTENRNKIIHSALNNSPFLSAQQDRSQLSATNSEDVSEDTDSLLEQRREEVRRKFLEAISRASQSQGDPMSSLLQ